MKTIKKIFLLAFSTLFFANTHIVNAQVTIGSELEPNKGSLLDLKEDDTAPGANSTKGFNLPRVFLTSVSSLEPCVANASDDDKANHKGLQVYNTNTNFGEGVFTWNGSLWTASTSKVKSFSWAALTYAAITSDVDLGYVDLDPGTYLAICNANFAYNDPTIMQKYSGFWFKVGEYHRAAVFAYDASGATQKITGTAVLTFDTTTRVNIVFHARYIGVLSASGDNLHVNPIYFVKI